MENNIVGFAGLGIMGTALSENLLNEGWQVVGYDPSSDRLSEHIERGGSAAQSIGELAARSPVIVSSLPGPDALSMVTGELVAGVPDVGANLVRTVIETSTLKLADKQAAHDQLAGAGICLLDCPLSGTGSQARTKDLIVYASGDESQVEACRPVFDAFARSTHYVGAFGNGSKMKFVANLLVAIHNVSTAEALVLGMKSGLDPADIQTVIADGAGTSRMFEIRGPMMVDADYENATMKLDVWQKDLSIIAEFARHLDCPTPLFTSTIPVYTAALAQGRDSQDTAAVCAILEQLAGLPDRSKNS